MLHSRFATATLFAVLTFCSSLWAADGDLDPTFSADGKATVLWDEDGYTLAEASAIAALDDGSMVVGGTMSWDPPLQEYHHDWVLAKLTRSGVLDTSWGENGRKRIAFDLSELGDDRLLGLYPEPDGSVHAVGSADDGSTQRAAMARLLPNGDGDPQFGDSGLLYLSSPWSNPSVQFRAAARQLDGKFLLAGECLRCPANTTHYNPFVLRLLEDGTPDTTLSFDGWAPVSDGGTTDDVLTAVGVTADGRVLLAFEADGELRIARLNWIGGLDGSFGGDGFVDLDPGIGSYEIVALEVDPGTLETYVVFNATANPYTAFVDRLTASGALDSTYGEDAGSFFSLEEGIELYDAELQGNGKLLVAGKINATGAQDGGFFLARLDGDGQPDLSFDGNGVARYEFDRTTNGEDVALAVTLSGGKPVAGGFAYDSNDETDMAILRVQNAYLFSDGFEPGNTLLWSATAP